MHSGHNYLQPALQVTRVHDFFPRQLTGNEFLFFEGADVIALGSRLNP